MNLGDLLLDRKVLIEGQITQVRREGIEATPHSTILDLRVLVLLQPNLDAAAHDHRNPDVNNMV